MKDRFGNSWALRTALLYLPIIGLYTWGWPFRDAKIAAIGAVNGASLWAIHHLGFFSGRSNWQDLAIAAIQLIGAAILALAWTILERRPKTNAYLREIIVLGARFDLAVAMAYYGVAKLGLTQGGQNGPTDWIRPLGEMPFSSLMWMWLGYSHVYEVFGGVLEFAGATLLLFRRTALLGAVLVFPTLIYITVIDSNFGAGPKAQAAQYVLLAVMIATPHFRRLADCFVHRRATAPLPSFQGWSQGMRGLGIVLRLLIVAWVAYFDVYRQVRTTINTSARSPLEGVYVVDRLEPDQTGGPSRRWHLLAINRLGEFIRVRTFGGKEVLLREIGVPWDENVRADARLNAAQSANPTGRLTFEIAPEVKNRRQYVRYFRSFGEAKRPGDDSVAVFDYARLDPIHLRLSGTLRGKAVRIDLRRIGDDRFALERTR